MSLQTLSPSALFRCVVTDCPRVLNQVDAVVDDEAPKPLRLGDGFLA